MRDGRRQAVSSALAGVVGAVAVAGVLALPYAVSGRLGALADGLSTISQFGSEYVAAVRDPAGGRARAVLGGLPCFVEQMPGLLVLALLGLANLFPRGGRRQPLAFVAYAFLGVALVGTTFTLRFFSHDNAQLWPALAVLAVRPAGLLSSTLDFLARPVQRFRALPEVVSIVGTLAAGAVAARPGFDFRWGYVHWMAERDHEIRAICQQLSPRLPEREPVLAWGWSAWSVYEHCARRAPGRVFKVIASVTSVNTNTCNAGYGRMQLRRDGGPAAFMRDLTTRPPSLLLWSTYFKDMGGDPLDDWQELRSFMEERYERVDERGPFVAFLRRDLLDSRLAISEERKSHFARAPVAELHDFGSSPSEGGSGAYGWSGRAGSVWTSTSRTPEKSALMASMTQCVTR
jgi:hypothetical protein